MGTAAMLVMWPRPFEQFFFPEGPGGCIWNLVAIGPVVSEEKSFEIVDGRTTETAYTISSPGAFGSGELKIMAQTNPSKWMEEQTDAHMTHTKLKLWQLCLTHHNWAQPKLFHQRYIILRIQIFNFCPFWCFYCVISFNDPDDKFDCDCRAL